MQGDGNRLVARKERGGVRTASDYCSFVFVGGVSAAATGALFVLVCRCIERRDLPASCSR